MNGRRDSALCCRPAFPWLARRPRDKDKRPGNEGKWGFYHPFPLSHRYRPTLPRLLRVCVCFCTGKLTKCASRFSDSLAYAHTLAQGCSLEKSLTQPETCGEMPKVWNIYTLPYITGILVCMCVQGSVFERTFISTSDIITLPQVEVSSPAFPSPPFPQSCPSLSFALPLSPSPPLPCPN